MVERSVSKYSINPRSDAYSLFIFAVKSGEFLEEGPDRKHYALAKKGETKLSQSALHWTKMMEMLELHLRRKRDTIVVILVVVAVISFAATYTQLFGPKTVLQTNPGIFNCRQGNVLEGVNRQARFNVLSTSEKITGMVHDMKGSKEDNGDYQFNELKSVI